MAITFIGSAQNSAPGGADVTLTLPGGTADGDLIIVAYAIGDNDGVNFNMAMLTAGYTEVADLHSDDAFDSDLGVYWKIRAGGETTAQVDGLGGADAAVVAVCMVFRGVDATTPMDVTPTTNTGLSTAHPNPPSIDHNNPAGVWTVIAGASGQNSDVTEPYTFPTGYTTDAVDISEVDSSNATVGMGYRTNPADPEDPGVMTLTGTDHVDFCWCACTMALRPAISIVPSPLMPRAQQYMRTRA